MSGRSSRSQPPHLAHQETSPRSKDTSSPSEEARAPSTPSSRRQTTQASPRHTKSPTSAKQPPIPKRSASAERTARQESVLSDPLSDVSSISSLDDEESSGPETMKKSAKEVAPKTNGKKRKASDALLADEDEEEEEEEEEETASRANKKANKAKPEVDLSAFTTGTTLADTVKGRARQVSTTSFRAQNMVPISAAFPSRRTSSAASNGASNQRRKSSASRKTSENSSRPTSASSAASHPPPSKSRKSRATSQRNEKAPKKEEEEEEEADIKSEMEEASKDVSAKSSAPPSPVEEEEEPVEGGLPLEEMPPDHVSAEEAEQAEEILAPEETKEEAMEVDEPEAEVEEEEGEESPDASREMSAVMEEDAHSETASSIGDRKVRAGSRLSTSSATQEQRRAMQAKQRADEEMRKSLLEKKDKVAKQMIILENEFDKIKAGYIESRLQEIEEEKTMIKNNTHPDLTQSIQGLVQKHAHRLTLLDELNACRRANIEAAFLGAMKEAKDSFAVRWLNLRRQWNKTIQEKQSRLVLEEARVVYSQNERHQQALQYHVQQRQLQQQQWEQQQQQQQQQEQQHYHGYPPYPIEGNYDPYLHAMPAPPPPAMPSATPVAPANPAAPPAKRGRGRPSAAAVAAAAAAAAAAQAAQAAQAPPAYPPPTLAMTANALAASHLPDGPRGLSRHEMDADAVALRSLVDINRRAMHEGHSTSIPPSSEAPYIPPPISASTPSQPGAVSQPVSAPTSL